MEINRKQFYNHKWYNKYSAALALAIIDILKEEEVIVDKYLDDLIQFSHNPLKANIKNLKNISKTKNVPGLIRMLEMVTDITSRGEKHEHLSIAIIQINFIGKLDINSNIRRSIHIMEMLIQQKTHRKYRPTIS